jgi:hypothetical protein
LAFLEDVRAGASEGDPKTNLWIMATTNKSTDKTLAANLM